MSDVLTPTQSLEKWAKIQPDLPAWNFYNDKLDLEETYTYKEMDNATNYLAAHLLNNCGLKPGDKVLLVFIPGLAFGATLFACFKAGLIGVPVYPPNPTRAGKDLLHFSTIQKDCGAKIVLTHASYSYAKMVGDFRGFFTFGKKEYEWPTLQWIQVDSVLMSGKTAVDVPRVSNEGEIAFLQYTSGSTSAPKGVMVTLQSMAHNMSYIAMSNPKVGVSWLPQYHDMGLIGSFFFANCGCVGHFLSPFSFLKDPLCYIRLLARVRATTSGAPNFAFALVVRKLKEAKKEVADEIRSLDLSSVTSIMNGAEPINAQVIQEFVTTFKPMGLRADAINPCYGLAEFTLMAGQRGKGRVQVDKAALEAGEVVVVREGEWAQPFTPIEGTVALVSCGQACPEHVTWAIVDPSTGVQCPANRTGELWLSGKSKTNGYFNRPEQTQEAFHARIAGSNLEFLRTGDAAFVHKGELYFCGRIKDIIIINGLNYYPQDMERAAESCHVALRPGCSAAFEIVQDADESECAVLVAELRADVPSSEYASIVEKIVSAVSLETGVYLAGVCLLRTRSVPKTTSGKISRASCKKAFLEGKLSIIHQWDELGEVQRKYPTSASPNTVAAESPVPSAPINVLPLAEVKQRIANMVKELAKLKEVRTDAPLLDVGLDSVAATELSGRLSKEFGIRIRPTIVYTSPTIDDVSARVVDLMKTANVGQRVAAQRRPARAVAPVVNVSKSEALKAFLKPEAFIAGWGIATPYALSTDRYLEIDRRERLKRGQSEEIIQQMAQIVRASKIHHRHSAHPFFLPEGKTPKDFPDAVGVMPEDIFTPYDGKPPFIKRMQAFQHTAVKLCVEAAERAVQKWGKDRGIITHIVTTCTSGWSEPGVACSVIKGLGLSEDIHKAELNFNGCFCGATCLRLARDFIRSGSAEAVLVVACETASTHYDPSLTETELLVALSLFADGAAAMVVAKEGVWKFSQTGSAVVPESDHLLGLRPPMKEHETGYIMTLSKYVAPSLYSYFSKGHGKDIIDKLYDPAEPKPALAIHPGGPRILEAVGDVFFELGWQEGSLQSSYDTFGHYGNLGSAAMLFVLSHRLDQDNIVEDKMITMAFGPGVTVEYGLLERANESNSNAAVAAATIAALTSACTNSTAAGHAAQVTKTEKQANKGADWTMVATNLLIAVAIAVCYLQMSGALVK